MELYIVRHGKTKWNQERRIQGRSDIPLLEEGREMARQTAEGLKEVPFDAIYSSPLRRAYETAEIIRGSRTLEIQTDDRLLEMSFGVGEGKDYVEPGQEGTVLLEGFYEWPDQYQAPERGESFYDLCSRADQFAEAILEKHRQTERILIVAHAAINQALFRYFEGLQIKELWEHGRQLNCATTIIRAEKGDFQVLERNKIFYHER